MVSQVSAESPRQLRHKAQRLDILEAGAAAIAEHGFHGMTMRGLARATGMGLATFYNYFSSKEDVLFSLQTEAFETMTASVRVALEHVAGPSDRLYVFVLNHLSFLAVRRAVMRVLVHEASALPPGKRKTVRLLKEGYFKICRDIVTSILTEGRGVTDGDASLDPAEVERVTYSVFGMLNWSYGWYDPRHHGTPQDVAKTIHALAVRGLAGHRGETSAKGPSDRGLGATDAAPLAACSGSGTAPASKRLHGAKKGSTRAQPRKAFEQDTV